MKTDVIKLNGDLNGREEALAAADRFAEYNELTKKGAMHIHLLTEEALCLVHGLMKNFSGSFWIESEEAESGLLVRICVSADRAVNDWQEGHLLSVSSKGVNESAKGILGKIREAFRVSLRHSGNSAYINEYSYANHWYGMGIAGSEAAGTPGGEMWSLGIYRSHITEEDNKVAKAAWDELEKSIIAKLSDDVKVWFRNEKTQIAIERTFAR